MKKHGLKSIIINFALILSLLNPVSVFAADYSTPFVNGANVTPGTSNSIWGSNGTFSYEFATTSLPEIKAEILTDIATGESHLTISGLAVTKTTAPDGINLTAKTGTDTTTTNVQVIEDFVDNGVDDETGNVKITFTLKGETQPNYPIGKNIVLGRDVRVILTKGDNTQDVVDSIEDLNKIPGLTLINNNMICPGGSTNPADYVFSSLEEYQLYKFYANNPTRKKAIGKNAPGTIDYSRVEADPAKTTKLAALSNIETSMHTIARGENKVCILLDDPDYTDLNDYTVHVCELRAVGTDEDAPKISDLTFIWDSDAKAPLPGTGLASGTPLQNKGSILAKLTSARTTGTTVDRNFDETTKDADLIVTWYKKDDASDAYPSTPFFNSQTDKAKLGQPITIPSSDATKHGTIIFENYGLEAKVSASTFSNGLYKVVLEDETGNQTYIEKELKAWDTEAPLLKADIYVKEDDYRFAKVTLIAEDNEALANSPYYFGTKNYNELTDADFSQISTYNIDSDGKYKAFAKDKAENIGGIKKYRYILCDENGNPIGDIDNIPYEDTDKEGELDIDPEYIDNKPPRVNDITYKYDYPTSPSNPDPSKKVVIIEVDADNGEGLDDSGLKYQLTYAGKDYPPTGNEQIIYEWQNESKFEEPFPVTYDSNGDGTADTDMYVAGYYKVYVKDAAGNIACETIYVDPDAIKVLETGDSIDEDGDGNCDICHLHLYKDSNSDGNCDECGNDAENCTGCHCYEAEKYNIRMHLPQPSDWAPGQKKIRITADDAWAPYINVIEYSKDGGAYSAIDISTITNKADWDLVVNENGIYSIRVNGKVVTMPAVVEKIDSQDPSITVNDANIERTNKIELNAKEQGTDKTDMSGLYKVTVSYSETDATVTDRTEDLLWITGSKYVDNIDITYLPMAKGYYKFHVYDKSGRKVDSRVSEVKYLNSLNPKLPLASEAKTEAGKQKIRDLITQDPTTYTQGNVTLTLNLDDMTGLGINPFMWEYRIAGSTETNVGIDAYSASKVYTATENQVVILRIKDIYGNEYESTPINIDIIDRTAPVITVVQNGTKFDVTVTDNLSGIDTVKWSGGALATQLTLATETSTGITAKTYSVDIPASGTYSFVATDKAGNATPADSPVNKTVVGIGNNSPIVESTGAVQNYYYYYDSGQAAKSAGRGSTTTNNYYTTPASSSGTSNNGQVEALQKQLAALQQSLSGSNIETDKLKAQLDAMNNAKDTAENPSTSSSSEENEEIKEEEPKEEDPEAEVIVDEPIVPKPLEEQIESFDTPSTLIDDVINTDETYRQAEEEPDDEISDEPQDKPSKLPLILAAIAGFALLGSVIAYFLTTKKKKSEIDDELLNLDDFEEDATEESDDEDMEEEDNYSPPSEEEVFDAEDMYK